MNKYNGKIISAENILKILKKKKQITSVAGFVMGSGKIYSVTSNGYLIISSGISGKEISCSHRPLEEEFIPGFPLSCDVLC